MGIGTGTDAAVLYVVSAGRDTSRLALIGMRWVHLRPGLAKFRIIAARCTPFDTEFVVGVGDSLSSESATSLVRPELEVLHVHFDAVLCPAARRDECRSAGCGRVADWRPAELGRAALNAFQFQRADTMAREVLSFGGRARRSYRIEALQLLAAANFPAGAVSRETVEAHNALVALIKLDLEPGLPQDYVCQACRRSTTTR